MKMDKEIITEFDEKEYNNMMEKSFVKRLKQLGISILIITTLVFIGSFILGFCLAIALNLFPVIIILLAGGLDDSIEARSECSRTIIKNYANL